MDVGIRKARRARVRVPVMVESEVPPMKPVAGGEEEVELEESVACLARGELESVEFLAAMENVWNLVSYWMFGRIEVLRECGIVPVLCGIAFAESADVGDYYRSQSLKVMSVVIGDHIGVFDGVVMSLGVLPKLAVSLKVKESNVVLNALKVVSVLLRSESMGVAVLDSVCPSCLLHLLTVHYLTPSIYKQIETIVYLFASMYNVDRFVDDMVAIVRFTLEKMPIDKTLSTMHALSFLAQSPVYAVAIQKSEVIMSAVAKVFETENVDYISVAAWVVSGVADNSDHSFENLDFSPLFLCLAAPDQAEAQYSAAHAISSMVSDPGTATRLVETGLVSHLLVAHQVDNTFDVACQIFEILQKITISAPESVLRVVIAQGGFGILLDSLCYDDANMLIGSLRALNVLARLNIVFDDCDIIAEETARLSHPVFEELLSHPNSTVCEIAAQLRQSLMERYALPL